MNGTEASRSGKVFHLQTVGVAQHDADRPKLKRELVVVVDVTECEIGLKIHAPAIARSAQTPSRDRTRSRTVGGAPPLSP